MTLRAPWLRALTCMSICQLLPGPWRRPRWCCYQSRTIRKRFGHLFGAVPDVSAYCPLPQCTHPASSPPIHSICHSDRALSPHTHFAIISILIPVDFAIRSLYLSTILSVSSIFPAPRLVGRHSTCSLHVPLDFPYPLPLPTTICRRIPRSLFSGLCHHPLSAIRITSVYTATLSIHMGTHFEAHRPPSFRGRSFRPSLRGPFPHRPSLQCLAFPQIRIFEATTRPRCVSNRIRCITSGLSTIWPFSPFGISGFRTTEAVFLFSCAFAMVLPCKLRMGPSFRGTPTKVLTLRHHHPEPSFRGMLVSDFALIPRQVLPSKPSFRGSYSSTKSSF